jgi:hypothetical protein
MQAAEPEQEGAPQNSNRVSEEPKEVVRTWELVPPAERNPVVEELRKQLAAVMRAENDALHTHYCWLLDELAGKRWRTDAASLERPPAALQLLGAGRQPVDFSAAAGRVIAGAECPPASEEAVGEACAKQQQQVPKSRATFAATASAAVRAVEVQRALLDSQLDTARRRAQAAEERVRRCAQRQQWPQEFLITQVNPCRAGCNATLEQWNTLLPAD